MKFLPQVEVKIAAKLANQGFSLFQNLQKQQKKAIWRNVCFVSDEKIWASCSQFFDKFLYDLELAGIDYRVLILKDAQPDEKNLALLKKQNCDLMIALGSGVISDLCKFVSAQKKVPYIIFPSAPSMNGYLSKNASLLIAGHKKTVPATLPLAVFADLEILKTAPKNLIQAGIGDSLCFYSCWFDWLLSHFVLGTKFDEKSFKIAKNKIDFLIKNYSKFSLNDDKLLKILTEILLLSGAAMTMAQGSYPASQSEHLIAHAFEMKYPKKAHKIFHGLQIATTTLTSLKMQRELANKGLLQITKNEFSEKNLAKFFNKKIATSCKKEYLAKINFDEKKINNTLKSSWSKQQKILQKILFDEKTLKKILKHFKIKTSPKALDLSAQQYQDLVNNAKFIRNRFTCLDL